MSQKPPVTQNPSYSLNSFEGILSFNRRLFPVMLLTEQEEEEMIILEGIFTTWLNRPLN